ncbi:glycosyltransferase family 39 protein [Candidatus Poribacteria bacterium]|nr:glycosyltransferase family 39 protein [Candidatus Poribacteria bacterium]
MNKQKQTNNVFTWVFILFCCIVSRLLSTIYYIEDIDSLRFALSMVEYDVEKLQPHFPAYPVFCFLAKFIYVLTGRYSLAFSIIGGISTFFTIFFTLKIVKIKCTSQLGIIAILILFMNPLLWLMSNRYMPDILGLACLLGAFYYILESIHPDGKNSSLYSYIGYFLAAILLGIKVSYIPLLIPVLLIGLKNNNIMKLFYAGGMGLLLWLIPLLWMTGWKTLLGSALNQTQGHFTDFGGTVSTNPDLWLRLNKIIESVVADGFGLYWQGRHLITVVSTILLLIIIFSNWKSIVGRTKQSLFGQNHIYHKPLLIGCIFYSVWLFVGQNVIYKSRHIIPLLPFFSIGIAIACNKILNYTKKQTDSFQRILKGWYPYCIGILVCFLLSYSYVTIHTVIQHTRPTAIAQIQRYLLEKTSQSNNELKIVSVPLIKYYLVSQGVKAEYIPIRTSKDLHQLNDLNSEFVVIGTKIPNRNPKKESTFYHNPYVNRMWSEIPVYEY